MDDTYKKLELDYIAKKINSLKAHIYTVQTPLTDIRISPENTYSAEAIDYDDSQWKTFSVGKSWGGEDKTCWFRIRFNIPDKMPGKPAVILQPGKRFFFKSSEGGDLREYELLVYLNSLPLQSIDVRRNVIPLWDIDNLEEHNVLAVEAFSGLEQHQHIFEQVDLVAVRENVEKLYYHCKNIYDSILICRPENPQHSFLLNVLRETLKIVDFLNEGNSVFIDSVDQAIQYVENKVFETNIKTLHRPTVFCTGHAHIDIAWMWQIKHSKKKAARTFANALRLMSLYPEYRFIQSQPQLYKYVQQQYPYIFDQIRKKVATGQWEAEGGMWVEPDCNLPSGESLVRQFLFGKRYFKKEFGIDSKIMWIPDAFGFCYSLPQIMLKSGIKYFMTTKLSWSQFIKIPYDTFWWQGVDGSRILTHFITTPDPRGWNDYSVDLSADNLNNCWENYRQKQQNDNVLMSYGWGDGGGGPVPEMMENSRRLKAIQCLPQQKNTTVREFFNVLEENAGNFPVWNEELYLQFHRGCYTSQAAVKRANRKAELLLRQIELFSAINLLNGAEYPQEEINNLWELVLLNQFHDILPGSSIPQVYKDCDADYNQIFSKGQEILQKAQQDIVRLKAGHVSDKTVLTAFNSLCWERAAIVRCPMFESQDEDFHITDTSGNSLPVQFDKYANTFYFYTSSLPAMGIQSFYIKNGTKKDTLSSLKISQHLMENRFFEIQLDNCGNITSIFDKRINRQVLQTGKSGNVFQLFEDRPARNNAWDIDIFYDEKHQDVLNLTKIKVIEEGPVRAGILVKRTFLNSTITQRIYIYDQIPRIDFETIVNWNQHQTLLKVAFPVDIHSNKAVYEIPFGTIERPTHKNTNWDYGRFEVPAQKWADLSEEGYGVSLLNDCKYGYDIHENTIRLTLIKSGIAPDPNADIGIHYFNYSLVPHTGSWKDGHIVKMAHEFNDEIKCVKFVATPSITDFSFFQIDTDHVIIDTIKKAEDDNNIIIRVYETYNKRGKVKINCFKNITRVVECNLMEEETGPVEFNDQSFWFQINPYEIKTLKLQVI